MVAKRALEQRYLLEATSTSYLTSLLMHHHVLSEPPLHAGQHFDEVLLKQSFKIIIGSFKTIKKF